MASRKCAFVSAALIVFSLSGMSPANAAGPECYTLSSLQGSYALSTPTAPTWHSESRQKSWMETAT